MRKNLFLPLFVATLAFIGCSTDPVSLPETLVEEPTAATVDPEVITIIEEMGFSTEDIFITDDAYIVEGDIMIRKDRVEKIMNELRTRQSYYGNDNVVSREKVVNIRIKKQEDSSKASLNNITDAILNSAIKAFNDVPDCVVNLIYATTGSFDIMIGDGSGNFANQYFTSKMLFGADIPQGGMPGAYIYVNSEPYPWDPAELIEEEWQWSTIADAKIKTALIHAIGHCLGLAHTDGNFPGDLGFQEDSNDTEWLFGGDDSSSIMNSSEHFNDNSVLSLSDLDKLALAKLYPTLSGGTVSPASTTVSVGGSSPLLTGSGAVGITSPTYRWQRNDRNEDSGWYDVTSGTGATSLKYTPPAVAKDQYYRLKATSGSTTVYSTVAKVLAKLTAGTISGAQNILPYSTPTILTGTTPTGGSGSGYSYQWQESQNPNSTSTWNNVSLNGTSANYQPSTLTGTRYYKRIVRSGYGSDARSEESNVIKITVFSPYLSGPDNLQYNTETRFSATAAPSGVSLNWTISPATYTIISGNLNSSYFNVKFNNIGNYTLTATYNLPGGKSISLNKTISATPPPPVISADKTLVTTGDDRVVFTVQNPITQSGVTYEWMVNGEISFVHTPIMVTSADIEGLTVKCRVLYSTNKYEWSNTIVVPWHSQSILPAPVIVSVYDQYAPSGQKGYEIMTVLDVPQNEQSQYLWEWEILDGGNRVASWTGRNTYSASITFESYFGNNLRTFIVRCRVTKNGQVSNWAETRINDVSGIYLVPSSTI
jgi:hypothetical protein